MSLLRCKAICLAKASGCASKENPFVGSLCLIRLARSHVALELELLVECPKFLPAYFKPLDLMLLMLTEMKKATLMPEPVTWLHLRRTPSSMP